MKITVSSKDICKTESFLTTDVATLCLWNSANEGSHLEVETGSDGNFKVIVYFKQGLSNEERALIYRSEKGIKLTSSGTLYVGS